MDTDESVPGRKTVVCLGFSKVHLQFHDNRGRRVGRVNNDLTGLGSSVWMRDEARAASFLETRQRTAEIFYWMRSDVTMEGQTQKVDQEGPSQCENRSPTGETTILSSDPGHAPPFQVNRSKKLTSVRWSRQADAK